MANEPSDALPVQDEFDRISLCQIGARFVNDRNAAIAWCRQYGLLAKEMSCPNCDAPCQEQKRSKNIDKVWWRCMENTCRKSVSIRRGSFFESSHLELWQVLGMSYLWASNVGTGRGLSYENLKKELGGIGNHTIVDWKQFMRDVAVSYFKGHPEQIGGNGVVVEVNERLTFYRKNNLGQLQEEIPVIAGYDLDSKKGFIVPLEKQEADALLDIIVTWVAPGSTVRTKMCEDFKKLNKGSHSLKFVKRKEGVQPNHVEAMWSRAKAAIGPIRRDRLGDHLAEFMWAQRFRKSAFFHLWTQIARDLYPV